MACVYVGIGSNIEREDNIRSGVKSLQQAFGYCQLSSVYDSEAVGFKGHAFFNLVARFDVAQDVSTVITRLREIENEHQRERNGPRFSSRTLDIDLLLYDQQILEDQDCHLPRDEILHSAFVLAPLAEIAPNLCHPVNGETYASLWHRFDASQQPIKRLDGFFDGDR